MTDAGEGPRSTLSATLITGGRSNLTYRLDDGTSSWVLRTPPRFGRTPSAHDVAREFRITRGLSRSNVPVAHPVLLCEDDSRIGLPFTVSRFVHGQSIQSRQSLDTLDDRTVSLTAARLVEALAALHAVNPGDVGLQDLGRPHGYAHRQIARWSQQWELVGDRSLDSLARTLSTQLQARHFSEHTHRNRPRGLPNRQHHPVRSRRPPDCRSDHRLGTCHPRRSDSGRRADVRVPTSRPRSRARNAQRVDESAPALCRRTCDRLRTCSRSHAVGLGISHGAGIFQIGRHRCRDRPPLPQRSHPAEPATTRPCTRCPSSCERA